MTPEEKQKIIRAIIGQQFMPEVMVAVHCFLQEYRQMVVATTEYKIITGFQGEVVLPTRTTLDLRPAQENLEKNLIYALTQK